MARVLVTGASGFIGQRMVAALTARGDDVVCLVRAGSDRSALAVHQPRFVVGDVGDASSLRAAVRDMDVVIHLASLLKAPWKRAFFTVNAEGTRNVAAACAQSTTPPVLVHMSSLAAAGPAPGHPRRESDVEAPASIYGRVKRDAERAALTYSDRVPVTLLRPPGVFGPRDPSFLRMFRPIARGVHVVPTRAVSAMSLVHVDDLCTAALAAAARGERANGTQGHGIYHVASPERPSYAELGRLIAAALDVDVRVLRLPSAVSFVACAASEAVARLRDVPALLNLDKHRELRAGSWTCDVVKVQTQLDFHPPPLPVRLRETADAYRAQGLL
jgi:nucleoside-diphosphate-sugar epimerase